MGVWTWAATALLAGIAVCLVGCLRGSTVARLVALQLASVVCILLLLVIAAATHPAPYYDVALTLAALSFAGSLAFVRLLERWL